MILVVIIAVIGCTSRPTRIFWGYGAFSVASRTIIEVLFDARSGIIMELARSNDTLQVINLLCALLIGIPIGFVLPIWTVVRGYKYPKDPSGWIERQIDKGAGFFISRPKMLIGFWLVYGVMLALSYTLQ